MRATLTLLVTLASLGGCSSLSDREMLHHAGAFSVMQIPLSNGEHQPIGANAVMVDPGNHVVYVSGDASDELAMVDGGRAGLVGYAAVRPHGVKGGPPERLIAPPFGGAVFVSLPDFDGVPVMVYIGGEPSYVLAADPAGGTSDPDDTLPQRLMIASEEAGLVLLADKNHSGGIDFQCLVIDDTPTLICPDSIPGEFPVEMVYAPHDRRVYLLSAPSVDVSVLRAFGPAGELWSQEFPGGPVEGRIVLDEGEGSIYVIQQHISVVHRFSVDGGEPEVMGVESGPVEIVRDPLTGWLYVACREAYSVVALNPATSESIPIVLDESPIAMDIDPHAGYLFVALREGRDMVVVDLPTLGQSKVDVFGPQLDVAVDTRYRRAFAVIEGESLSRMVY